MASVEKVEMQVDRNLCLHTPNPAQDQGVVTESHAGQRQQSQHLASLEWDKTCWGQNSGHLAGREAAPIGGPLDRALAPRSGRCGWQPCSALSCWTLTVPVVKVK
jgi:hypothetical protein